MDFAVAILVGNSGRLAAIWLTLILLAVVALFALSLPRGVHRPRQIAAWLADNVAQRRAEAGRRAEEAAEAIRYAGEVTVAARGAATTAERRREECQRAQAVVEAAWQAHQRVDAALTRARRAAAYGVPDGPLSDEDRADRARALHRFAQAAHRRGDLSDTQLRDALTHRNGWDPALHPVEQELALARAAAGHRFRAYRAALDAEQAAWQASDIAAAAVGSLRHEVSVAEVRAEAARAALPVKARPARSARPVAATA